jgi:hypothetical protein
MIAFSRGVLRRPHYLVDHPAWGSSTNQMALATTAYGAGGLSTALSTTLYGVEVGLSRLSVPPSRSARIVSEEDGLRTKGWGQPSLKNSSPLAWRVHQKVTPNPPR